MKKISFFSIFSFGAAVALVAGAMYLSSTSFAIAANGSSTCHGPYECTSNNQCSGSKPICSNHTCRAPNSNSECSQYFPTTPYYGKDQYGNGGCRKCTSNSHCSGSTPVCDSFNCRALRDSDCSGSTPYASGSSCVQCTNDGHCNSGYWCHSNSCSSTCNNDSECSSTYGSGYYCSGGSCQAPAPSVYNSGSSNSSSTPYSGNW